MDRRKVERRKIVRRFSRGHDPGATQFHQSARGGETQETALLHFGERRAECNVLLHELLPQRVVLTELFEFGDQPKMVSVLPQQPQTEAMDGSKESAIERGEDLERHASLDQ